MKKFVARKVEISSNNIVFFSIFKKKTIVSSDISRVQLYRIPSLFDEIAMTITVRDAAFVVSERVASFLELADFLHFDQIFGPLWYKYAEEGKELSRDF